MEAGHEVVGVHLLLHGARVLDASALRSASAPAAQPPRARSCSADTAADALRAAETLGIDLLTWDLSAEFDALVLTPFLDAYRTGRTPNPCVRCNQDIKFGALITRAQDLGFDAVCTGHYARLGADTEGRLTLSRARDLAKDQSYVVAGVGPDALSRALLPLGDFPSKAAVRERAAAIGLTAATKPDSTDLCFVPDGDVRSFLRSRLGAQPGPILDERGVQVGTHGGAVGHTMGQRRGLALPNPAPDGHPRYVSRVDVAANTLHVAPKHALRTTSLEIENLLTYAPLTPGAQVEVQVRAHGTPLPAHASPLPAHASPLPARPHPGARWRIDLLEPAWAVAPGQSAVLYQGDRVLGHGIITNPESSPNAECEESDNSGSLTAVQSVGFLALGAGDATGRSPITDGSQFPVATVDRRAADQALAEFEAGRDALAF